jgi:hypothetical protein
MRNHWAPLDREEGELVPREWIDHPNIAISGAPLAERLCERVARYLALLDLWESVTAPRGGT